MGTRESKSLTTRLHISLLPSFFILPLIHSLPSSSLVKGHSIGSQANANIYDCTIPDSSEARTMCGTQKVSGG